MFCSRLLSRNNANVVVLTIQQYPQINCHQSRKTTPNQRRKPTNIFPLDKMLLRVLLVIILLRTTVAKDSRMAASTTPAPSWEELPETPIVPQRCINWAFFIQHLPFHRHHWGHSGHCLIGSTPDWKFYSVVFGIATIVFGISCLAAVLCMIM